MFFDKVGADSVSSGVSILTLGAVNRRHLLVNLDLMLSESARIPIYHGTAVVFASPHAPFSAVS
jgi:hypothetical protein